MTKIHQRFLKFSLLVILSCSLLWTTPGFAASVRIDNAFSVAVSSGWEVARDNFSKKIPMRLAAVFDGADVAEKNLRMVGWKRAGNTFPAAFAIIHTTDGEGGFNRLLQASDPEERRRIATRFADIMAQKVQQDYAERRGMNIDENAVEVVDAGPMTVVLADAVIRDGATLRTRSATIFFHKKSLAQIITIYDQKYPDLGKILDEIPTSLEWVGE